MKLMRGYRPKTMLSNSNPKVLDTTNLTDAIDWRVKGAVTPVKNQLSCGSCWAFSSVDAVEGAMFIKTGVLAQYSVQQLVDCSASFGNYGCNGGQMDNAFEFMITAPLEIEDDYPYTGIDGVCNYSIRKGVGLIDDYQDVIKLNPDQMKAAISLGPVSVAVEANQIAF